MGASPAGARMRGDDQLEFGFEGPRRRDAHPARRAARPPSAVPAALPSPVPRQAPAVAPARPPGPAGAAGELTLDSVITGTWEALHAHASVPCPACRGAMTPRYGAGPRPVGGRCRDCGATLA